MTDANTNEDERQKAIIKDLIEFSSDEAISDDTTSSVELSDTPARPPSTKSSLERRQLRAEQRATRRADRAARREARAKRRQERREAFAQKRQERQVLRNSLSNARKAERSQKKNGDVVDTAEVSKAYEGHGALGGSDEGFLIKTSDDTVDVK